MDGRIMEQALSGLKVLEYGNSVPAAFCTKFLADLGAEVIKVERPGTGDATRRLGPFVSNAPELERSLLFLYLNTNKLGITLNMEKPLGKSLFQRLAEQTDILLEDNPPETARNLGLRYDLLKSMNPRLIMASITPFGQSGPYRDYRSTDLVTFHMSGYGYITPGGGVDQPDAEPPLRVTGRVSEFGAGIVAAIAVMCGVFRRNTTGEGQYIDLSQMEAGCHLGIGAIFGFLYSKINRDRIKSGINGNVAILPTQDGYICFQGLRQYQWDALLELMGGTDSATREFFKSQPNRVANWDAVELVMSQWSMQHTKGDLTRMAQAKGIPASPVNTPGDIVEAEQMKARAFLVDVDHPAGGRTRHPGAPFQLSQTPWQLRRPAPRLGQHNEDIYCRRLGYSRRELARACELGVV
ncbi:MAG: CoA transferase [Chloroflexota bacterium]